MHAELRLTLLGTPQVTLGGVPVTDFSYRKSLALLCYVAATGRPHTREALTGVFWPDTREANARASLRKALADLRTLVPSHLAATRHEVGLDRDAPVWLDVTAFEAGLSAFSSHADADSLEAAAALYQGDFMEGFYVSQAPAFEEWVLAERVRLRELALQALHALSAHFANMGFTGRMKAVEHTTRLLALDPLREEAHRKLMWLHALDGQRGAALAQYEACRQILDEELGVAPSGQTTTLYEQIRDGIPLQTEGDPEQGTFLVAPSE